MELGLVLGALVGERYAQAACEVRLSRRRCSRTWNSRSSVSKISASGSHVICAGLRLGLALLDLGPAGRPGRIPGPDVAVALDLDLQRLGQRVDDRDADAVEAAGDLVAVAVAELAAGVEDRHDDLERPACPPSRSGDGDAAAVSATVTESSGWMVTSTRVQLPASASSTELSTTS